MIPRTVLRDGGLLVLALVTVAVAAYVLMRTPDPAAPTTDRLAAPTAAPSPTPTPGPRTLTALFFGADLLLAPPAGNVAHLTAKALGWQPTVDAVPGTGYLSGQNGQTYVDRVPVALARSDYDIVVVVSSAVAAEELDPRRLGGNSQAVVGAVRTALPEAQIVLVGPLEDAPVQRNVLSQTAARFGAVYVDPAGRSYLPDRPDLVGTDGLPTAAGAVEVARRLAADLRRVLPRTLLPPPSPTPAVGAPGARPSTARGTPAPSVTPGRPAPAVSPAPAPARSPSATPTS